MKKYIKNIATKVGLFIHKLLSDDKSVSSKRINGMWLLIYCVLSHHHLTDLLINKIISVEIYKAALGGVEVLGALAVGLLGASVVDGFLKR